MPRGAYFKQVNSMWLLMVVANSLVSQLLKRAPPRTSQHQFPFIFYGVQHPSAGQACFLVLLTCRQVSKTPNRDILKQVWSLTQFYSVDISKSRIGVKKCGFNKLTIKVCVSCCWRCPGTSAPSAPHLTVSLYLCSYRSNTRGESRALEGRRLSSKSPSRVQDGDGGVAGRNGRK